VLDLAGGDGATRRTSSALGGRCSNWRPRVWSKPTTSVVSGPSAAKYLGGVEACQAHRLLEVAKPLEGQPQDHLGYGGSDRWRPPSEPRGGARVRNRIGYRCVFGQNGTDHG
jgi:hypothetical protein